LASEGKIKLIPNVYAAGYEGASTVVLRNGERLEAAAVVVATGYICSWGPFIDG